MTRILFYIAAACIAYTGTALLATANAGDGPKPAPAATEIFSGKKDCDVFDDCNKGETNEDRYETDIQGDTAEIGNGIGTGRSGNGTIGQSIINLLEPASGR